MKTLPAIVLLALLGCASEPSKQNRAGMFYQGLDDLYQWHPSRAAAGQHAYDGLMALEPNESVPVLLQGVLETSSTKIDDGHHPPPDVGHVCFLMLVKIFNVSPKEFDRDGVWFYPHEDNPIYALNIDGPGVRQKVVAKFTKMASDRKWLEPPK